MLEKLGLRVACLVALVPFEDYYEVDAETRPVHATDAINKLAAKAYQTLHWLAARRVPQPGGPEAFAGKWPARINS